MQLTGGAFRKADVLELVPGITYNQLNYWARTGLLEPSIQKASGYGSKRVYSWLDLIALQTISDLLQTGATVQRIRKAVKTLRRYGKQNSLTDCVLVVSSRGEIYEVIKRGEVGTMLTEHPGQTFWIAPVGDFAQDLRQRIQLHKTQKEGSVEALAAA